LFEAGEGAMSNYPNGLPRSGSAVSDLLAQASAVLAREMARGSYGSQAPALSAGRPAAGGAIDGVSEMAQRSWPEAGAGIPAPPPGVDTLRRQAHELIETLLATFTQRGGARAQSGEVQVPLLRCIAPVQAGGQGCATMRVANDEDTPSEASLYSTNFVADSGSEIPALRVTVSPRRLTISAKSEACFEITIAVPQQTPAGLYSGLIQVMGATYVKAVLVVEVL